MFAYQREEQEVEASGLPSRRCAVRFGYGTVLHTYVYIYIYTYVYIYIYTHMYTCIHICVCICIWMCMYYMLCGTVRFWYGTVRYCMVRYGSVCYGMAWHGMVWYGTGWYSMVCCCLCCTARMYLYARWGEKAYGQFVHICLRDLFVCIDCPIALLFICVFSLCSAFGKWQSPQISAILFGNFTVENYSLRDSPRDFHESCAETYRNPVSRNSLV